MDARKITESYSVSPQISPEDLPEIAAAGFTTVICNRPDAEVPASHQAATIAEAARAAGLHFVELPLTHQTMTPDNVSHQNALIEASTGPVLAYCASGTRSSVVWALSQAAKRPAADIIAQAAQAGYDLQFLRPTLDAMHNGH